MSDELLRRLAGDLGGEIKERGVLPDGSGWATMSMPLPDGHWSTVQSEKYEAPPMPFRMGLHSAPVLNRTREMWAEDIRRAGRYAYRAATMQGREPDLDPDALIQNLVVGMLGYWTADGLTDDVWANPDPVPPAIG